MRRDKKSVSEILKHLRRDGTALGGQINFRLELMGLRSFDLYESKAGRAVASALSENLKISADDEAFQVQFPGVDPNRLPFLADNSKERQHICQRHLALKIIKRHERRHKSFNEPFVLWLDRFYL
jgi:2,3-bisphosphoglycerate-independent phosphoglycerate mutase